MRRLTSSCRTCRRKPCPGGIHGGNRHEALSIAAKDYGIVPFYWWLGDKLTKERLSWQLDQLEGHHISGLQVNYAHSDQGGPSWGLTCESDPPLFSED